MGSKKRKQKQAKRQKYIKKKQEQNIPFSQKVVIMIEKTFRYICMALYVILCMYSFGVFYSFEITPNIIESILVFILVAIELVLFVIFFDTVWPSHESKSDRKRKKRKKSSYASSSSSGFGDYSSNDCSSSSDGGGDCGGGGD
ncbi:hypothetical protein S3E15_04251 [Bacillus mycoides]|uniref:Uncharacterized protein n=1 Tax=Bacillus mycoides TaxID=1405 RepID=A0AAP7WAQ3_BACMY|nr:MULTISPECIES: hypothetical protein [Bacillus cereus group]AJH21928.1 hypothetical protein BG05_1420 [Bacillus mycoides]EOO36493.1 hypothetical protein IKK_04385 [Bacillus mycoides]KMQ21779.1 hypothetical protein TU70_00510 [Bacillus mycoides]KUH43885.1 hypothetical protein M2E15_5785 [Bacillus mycoides]MBG9600409.1 hypothetical protein [Bacillus mycoides]